MNTYRISYERNGTIPQNMNTIVRAQGYTIDDGTLTLLTTLPSGQTTKVASFRNWNSITDTGNE